jgi:hypothetical protein
MERKKKKKLLTTQENDGKYSSILINFGSLLKIIFKGDFNLVEQFKNLSILKS